MALGINTTELYRLLTIYLLVRETKTLYPIFRKLCQRRSINLGTIKIYMKKECRMQKKKKYTLK